MKTIFKKLLSIFLTIVIVLTIFSCSRIMNVSAASYPSETQGLEVTWSSSDSNVATVNSNGEVFAVGKGSAIITATTSDGAVAECSVNVYLTWWQSLLKIITMGVY